MNNILEGCNQYCSGCGLCETVCPVKAIKVNVQEGAWRPTVDESCINCGKCRRICPNLCSEKYSYQEFNYSYWGHSLNFEHRKMAASGGITSELLAYMLKKGYVDYIVTADMYYNDQNGQFSILNSFEMNKVYEHSGSNYCPVNIGRAVNIIREKEGICAIVCLPCLARGIRKLCKSDEEIGNKVKFIITLLCNHVPTYNATEYIKKKYKVLEPDMIKYRGNGWFGFLRMFNTRSDYSEYFSVPYSKYFMTAFSKYFWQEACVKCVDHFGKYSDVAMGDADFVKYRGQIENDGETICFVNNEEVHKILMELCAEKIIEVSQDFTEEELFEIYGPLCDSKRASEKNLQQNYRKILFKEKIYEFLIKTHLIRIEFLWKKIINLTNERR